MTPIRTCTAAAVVMVLMAGSSEARTQACFDEFDISDKPPSMALTGKLREVQTEKQYLEDHPAVSRRFYVLDLDEPTCLNTVDGTDPDIRSVHVYSMEPSKIALLRRYRGKRVSVRFTAVFPPHTAHHRRPMVGDVDTVKPLR